MDDETIEELHSVYVKAIANDLNEFNDRWYSVQHWIPKSEPLNLQDYLPVIASQQSTILRVTKAIDANIQEHFVQLRVSDLFSTFWSQFTDLVQACENLNLSSDIEKFLFWISQLPYIDLDPEILKPSFCKFLLKEKNLALLGVITNLSDFIRAWVANISIFACAFSESVQSEEALNLCVRTTLGEFVYFHRSINFDSYLSHQYSLALERLRFVNLNAATCLANRELLGQGANGSVWRAEFGGNFYAIKSVHLFKGISEKIEANFIAEHCINEFIHLLFYPHPNIVKYYHCFLNTNTATPDWCTAYSNKALDFVFEFCDNGSLNEFLLTYPDFYQTDTALATTACSMLSPLAFLHSHNIVHRDIKPTNFLVTSSEMCKLADIGESIHETYEKDVSMRLSTCTPSFTAPELPHAAKNDASYSLKNGDVWGLGCVLYTLSLSYNPFEEEENRNLPPPPLLKNHKFIGEVMASMHTEWHNRLSAAQALGYFYAFKEAPHDCESLETCNTPKMRFAILQSGIFSHPRKSILPLVTTMLRDCLADLLYIPNILYYIARSADYSHLFPNELVEEVLLKAVGGFQSLSNFSKLQFCLIILGHLGFGSPTSAHTFPDFLWREGILQLLAETLRTQDARGDIFIISIFEKCLDTANPEPKAWLQSLREELSLRISSILK